MPVARTPTVERTVLELTGAKVAANASIRWVYPFLPAIGRGMGADVGLMSAMAGIGELGGLASVVTGPSFDRGYERRWLVGGLVLVAAGCALAPVGAAPAVFAIGFGLITAGVGTFTTAGQTWIGHRVAYARRARAIGTYETAWAIALLVVAPVAAALVGWVAWWTPFALLAIVNLLVAVTVRARFAPDAPHLAPPRTRLRLPVRGWAVLLTSWCVTFASMGVFVSYGAWLEDAYAVPVGGIGVVTVLAALVELGGSGLTALRSDRWGKHTAVRGGLVVMLVALGALAAAGGSVVLGVLALVLFLGSFELAFVSNIALVTEAAVASRGAAVGLSNAVGTGARAAGVALGGAVYEAWGIGGVAVSSGTATVLAFAAASVAASRPRPRAAPLPSGTMG